MSSDIHKRDKQLYTTHDYIEWQPPPVTRIIKDVLNLHGKMMIFGDEGSWKSMLAMHTAFTLSRGTNWLGIHTIPVNVYRLQVEMPQYMDRERIIQYCEGSEKIYKAKYTPVSITPANLTKTAEDAHAYAYRNNIISRTEHYIHIDESFGFESLKKNIETCITHLPEAPLVVILDPLFRMFNRDLSSEQDVKVMLDKLDSIIMPLPISVIIIHHTRKAITDDKGRPSPLGSQDATGSRALPRWADTILRIDPAEDDETKTRVNMTFTKHRIAQGLLPLLTVRWDKETLHPQILYRKIPTDESDDETELRSEADYTRLE